MVKIIILFVLLCGVTSCYPTKFPYDSEGLTYRNKFVFNNQIKMDEIFYCLLPNRNHMYFFENGYVFGCNFPNFDLIESKCYKIDDMREIPYDWGVYIISNDTLKLQRIAAYGRGKYGKFMVEELWAKIEAEGTTLRYFQKRNIDGKISVMDEVYKFYPCTNKPESTNILMQEKKK